ncbi:transcriptional regulator with XRE-family HTH domain [Pedobacter sp. UYP24]
MVDQKGKKTKIVAENIRKIRAFRNYTQDYLAAKLGISQNAYSKIELGYSKLTLERTFEIAIILEVEMILIISLNHLDITKLIPSSH